MKRPMKLMAAAAALFFAHSLSAQDYQLVWSDEFDSNTLGTNWYVEVVSNPSNNELQYYTNRASNARIENGNLVLTARRESYGGRSFTSGRVNSGSRVTFTHGKIEARIKLPYTARGLWPAFWMMGDDIGTYGWPYCGELDILEAGNAGGYGGRENSYYNGALHWGPSWDQHMEYATTNNDGYVIIDGNYHLFTCEWTSTQVRCYVDNRSSNPYYVADIGSGTSPYSYFHKPFFILFNLAVGGLFPAIYDASGITALPNSGSEASMYVDYVRVYQTVNNISYKENDKDNIDDGGGTDPDPEPVVIPAAPTPTKAQADVKSLYSDQYTKAAPGIFVGSWGQTTATEEVELATGDKAYKCSNFNYLGFQYDDNGNAYVDASDMNYMHLDIYPLSDFTINFYPIVKQNGSTYDTQSFPISLKAGQWNSVDIPLTGFINMDTNFQVKFDGGGGQTFYLDNMYYWKGEADDDTMGPAPTPTKPQSDVAAIYSNKYTCPTLSVPDWAWQFNPASYENVTLAAGDQALHLTNYSFSHFNLSSAINASDMTYFHVDVYPIDLDEITIHLNGDQNVFVSRSLTRNKWNSFDIPMSAFTNQGQSVSNITGIKFTGTGGEDADGSKEVYLDNIYFYKGAVNAIERVSTEQAAAKWYNLQGVRVNPATLQKGIYIVDGKKVVVP